MNGYNYIFNNPLLLQSVYCGELMCSNKVDIHPVD